MSKCRKKSHELYMLSWISMKVAIILLNILSLKPSQHSCYHFCLLPLFLNGFESRFSLLGCRASYRPDMGGGFLCSLVWSMSGSATRVEAHGQGTSHNTPRSIKPLMYFHWNELALTIMASVLINILFIESHQKLIVTEGIKRPRCKCLIIN